MCENNISNLLKEWGFEEYIDIFTEHEIDANTLGMLDSEILKELIPKTGPRIKFLGCVRNYNMLKEMDIIFSNTINQQTLQDDELTVSTQDSSAVSDTSGNIASGTDLETPPKKKIKCDETENLNLEELLNASIDGRFITSFYAKNDILNRKCRNMLSEIIICYMLRNDDQLRITNNDFSNISQKITNLFPNEDAGTYFVPPIPKLISPNEKSVLSRGRLIDKYRNKRRNIKFSSTVSVAKEFSPGISDIRNIETDSEITWLKNNEEPMEEVLIKWKSTFHLRKKLKKSFITESCISVWPGLSCSNGYILVSQFFYCDAEKS